ncbi:MAG: hypothetical protein JST42_25735 [Bacteroidetes bacterium]|nr:hypothetical protein [Bacteroidota bacterium]
MYFQKVLKGIPNLAEEEVRNILDKQGICCNWWRNKHEIYEAEVKEQLTEANLIHHLNDYDKALPSGHPWEKYGKTYGDVTAFISTTAGAVQRNDRKRRNIRYPPFITALRFATSGFTGNGWIFYGYVVTLGKPSVELRGFSEEVRELHIYTDYLPYHHEGEITAKISIPSVNIEKAEYYEGPAALKELRNRRKPSYKTIIDNSANYQTPEKYSNIREVLNP